MGNYLRRLWKTKSTYIVALGFVLAAIVIQIATGRITVDRASAGIGCAAIISLVLLYGPVVYLDVTNSKIANPKTKFVEPPLRILIPIGLLLSIAVYALLTVLVFAFDPVGSYVKSDMDADGFVGSFAIMSIIIVSLFGPGAVYTIYIRRHYKRIVEYNSAEWHRLRAKR